jgi:hypothetical protein
MSWPLIISCPCSSHFVPSSPLIPLLISYSFNLYTHQPHPHTYNTIPRRIIVSSSYPTPPISTYPTLIPTSPISYSQYTQYTQSPPARPWATDAPQHSSSQACARSTSRRRRSSQRSWPCRLGRRCTGGASAMHSRAWKLLANLHNPLNTDPRLLQYRNDVLTAHLRLICDAALD